MSNLHEKLQTFGLGKYESSVYIASLLIGKASASDISKQASIPVTAIYPILTSLEKKGFIQTLGGKKKIYVAIDPKIALDSYIGKKFEMLTTSKESFIEELANVPQSQKQKNSIQLTHGATASAHTARDFMNSAKKRVFIFGWRFSSGLNLFEHLHNMKRLVKTKVDVRIIITDPNPKYRKVITEFIAAGVKVKYFPSKNFSIIVKDSVASKITLKSPELEEKINVVFYDKDLSAGFENYFLTLWKKSRKF